MRGILLDTNVVSELSREQPSPKVLQWLEEESPQRLYVSTVTVGELLRGVHHLPDGFKRLRYESWITNQMLPSFLDRILAFDQEAAMIWGRLLGEGDRAGRPRPMIDAQIAAIAIRHDLAIATRNTKDFSGLGIEIVNPWTS